MNKRLLSMFFAVMLIFTSVDVTAFAQNANSNVTEEETEDSVQDLTAGNIASGTIDNDLGGITWVIDASGKLTVSGKGEIAIEEEGKRYDHVNGKVIGTYKIMPWYEYADSITSVVIQLSDIQDVTRLLEGCKNVTTVDVSNFETSNRLFE